MKRNASSVLVNTNEIAIEFDSYPTDASSSKVYRFTWTQDSKNRPSSSGPGLGGHIYVLVESILKMAKGRRSIRDVSGLAVALHAIQRMRDYGNQERGVGE